VESLNVFFEQTLVGIIRLDDKRSFSFQYSKNWLEASDTFQLSVSLPMQEAIFPDDKAKPFFTNLLPESAVRELIARQLGISEKNDFMLLKRIGGECAGAITILPESILPESREQYSYRQLPGGQLSELIKKIPERPLFAGEDGIRMSLAGAQEKVVLLLKNAIFYIPLNGAPSNYILKPGMLHFPSSIENECFCMMLADDLNLPVPPVKILKEKGQKALLIKRYDRVYDNDSVRRLHQEDFCQAMGLSHELKYHADGGPGLKECFGFVREYSSNPIKDLQQLLQWVFFNYLIGNMDAHSKNLSFLYHSRQIRLAPFYDMLCTNIYEDLAKRLAMKIGGENRTEWIMARHWERLAKEVKISPSVLKNQLSNFCYKLPEKVENTYVKFIERYERNKLVENITTAIKQRTVNTLNQLK